MLYLIAGLVIFLGAHSFAAMRGRRDGDIKSKLGYGPYMGLFSLVSLAGFALIIYGYGQARLDPEVAQPIWTAPEWTRHIILTVMPLAFILLAAAYAPTGYIKKYSKHPMITAVKTWALVHVIYNGDLPSILLFGGFLVYGGLSRVMARIRGDEGQRRQPANVMGDIIAVVVGLIAYTAFAYYLHPMWIGVSVLPT